MVGVIEAECNDSHVAAIEGRGRNVEDSGDGFDAAEGDEFKAAAEKNNEPDTVERCVGIAVDFPQDTIRFD